METIGFIGVGKIGMPISENLIKSGRRVVGYRRSSLAEFEKIGGVPAQSAADVGAQADIVFSCLPSMEALDDVVQGPQGLVHSARPGQIVVELGSHPLSDKQRQIAPLAQKGATFIDGEVSGTPGMVVAKKGAIYLAGNAAACKKLEGVVAGFADSCLQDVRWRIMVPLCRLKRIARLPVKASGLMYQDSQTQLKRQMCRQKSRVVLTSTSSRDQAQRFWPQIVTADLQVDDSSWVCPGAYDGWRSAYSFGFAFWSPISCGRWRSCPPRTLRYCITAAIRDHRAKPTLRAPSLPSSLRLRQQNPLTPLRVGSEGLEVPLKRK